MRRTIVLTLLIITGISLGILIQTDPGYLLISYRSFSFETTLWFALLSFLLLMALLHYFFKILHRIISSPSRIKRWMAHRQIKQTEACTHLAIDAFLQHDWRSAINHANNAAKSSKKPSQMELFSALCASLANRHNHARELLMNSSELNLNQRIVDAALLLKEKKFDLAKLQLQHLQQEKPYHPGITRLLLQSYQALHAWKAMQDLSLIARKHQILEIDEQLHYEITAIWHLLKQIESAPEIDELWQTIPRNLKQDPMLIAAYLESLAKFELWDDLSKKVKKLVGKPPELSILITALPLCYHDSKSTLKWLESLEKKNEPSADLYHLKAACLEAQGLQAKAKKMIEDGLALNPNHPQLLSMASKAKLLT